MSMIDEWRRVGLRIRRTMIPNMVRTRLYKEGTYADGTPIVTYFAIPPMVYASRTITKKERRGQPTDRVTLRDTGAFYRSIRMESAGRGGQLTGDTDKFSSNVNPDGILDITLENEETIGEYVEAEIDKIMARNENNLLSEP